MENEDKLLTIKRFDIIAKDLGWIKPYGEVPLWYHCKEGYCLGKFSVNEEYENWGDHELLNDKGVEARFNYFSGNTFKEENKDWVLPMLASDYYYHRANKEDRDRELEYSLMAIKSNSDLKPESFSSYLRDEIINTINK